MPPVAGERQLDGFAGQRLVLAGEQQPGSAVDVVTAAARPAGRIARPALGEPPAPVPHSLFPLFYLVEIRHRQLPQSQFCIRSRMPIPARVQCEYGNCMIVYLSNPAEGNGQQAGCASLPTL
jgi:hypothetical protein